MASKALSVTTLEAGDEKTFPREGDVVEAFYTGTLADSGTQFDSNVGKDPLRFTVGDGSMIEGWDSAIREVSLGAKARVFVPAKRAYAEHGYPSPEGEGYAIPPDSDLVYELQVVKVEKPKAAGSADAAPEAKKKLSREEQEAAEKEQMRLWKEQMMASSAEASQKSAAASNNKAKAKKKKTKKKGKK